jgi:thiamine-phosphate pyrophosphorylase
MNNPIDKKTLRILDANINRLREALRVMEEYYRFIKNNKKRSVQFKTMRHSLEAIEQSFDRKQLLANRDVTTDPFASVNRPEEMERKTAQDILTASLKRAQEASRVIEEYAKITDKPQVSNLAKELRFTLYSFEKQERSRTRG